MLYNKKKLTACVLTAILGLSYAVYPVHAQETGVSQQSDTGELLELDKTAVPVEENKEPQITPELDTQEQAESKYEKEEVTNESVETENEIPPEFTEQTEEEATPQGQIPQDTISPSGLGATNEETYSELKPTPQPNFNSFSITASSIKTYISNYDNKYGLLYVKLDSGEWEIWETASITFENLKSNSSHTIEVKFGGNADSGYTESEVNSRTITTLSPTYTISIPAGTLEAGNSQSNIKISVDESKSFSLGYEEKVNIKIKNDNNVTTDAKLKLKHENTSDEITSALLVNGTALGDINKNVATFTMDNKTSVSISFAKPTELVKDVPEGVYRGNIVFEISYQK